MIKRRGQHKPHIVAVLESQLYHVRSQIHHLRSIERKIEKTLDAIHKNSDHLFHPTINRILNKYTPYNKHDSLISKCINLVTHIGQPLRVTELRDLIIIFEPELAPVLLRDQLQRALKRELNTHKRLEKTLDNKGTALYNLP